MSVSMQGVNVLRFVSMGGLKSTQERQERQQKCASQVDFFEKQKENLKNMQCTSLEDIARKLDMFHSYEDQIAAAKKEYNNSQMSHVLDEAREIGEKIAEAAEKTAPKTPEEREKERIEEAAGTEEESKGMLSEIMEEITEVAEELQEELEEELEKEMLEENAAGILEEGALEENAAGILEEGALEENAAPLSELDTDQTFSEALEEKIEQNRLEKEAVRRQQQALEQTLVFRAQDAVPYQHIDYRL